MERHKMKIRLKLSLLLTSLVSLNLFAATTDDPFLWLEDVEGEKALEWVGQQNAISQKELENYSEFASLEQQNLAVYQSQERIPYVSKRGEYYYNFWQDKEHVRGIYRRTSLAEYRKDKPKWETVIDFDQLAESENENWVYKGMDCLYPKRLKCLVYLSRGGADATVVREFDMQAKAFVKDGFYLPEAKSSVSWIDENTLFVGTDFGPDSMTDSGYPRIAKRWKRGTPLAEAEFVVEGKKDDISIGAYRSYSRDGHLDMVYESPSFFTNIIRILVNGEWQTLVKPDTANVSGYFNKQLFIQLKEDWKLGNKVYPSGAIIYDELDTILAGKANYKILLESSANKTLSGITFTKSSILVNWLEDVKSVLERYTMQGDGSYTIEQIGLPKNGTISVVDVNEDSDDFMVIYENFLQPDSFYLVNGKDLKAEKLKQLPAFFDASPYESKQYFATSKDGTKVPYFVVMAKNTKLNGKNPTLLYGYGGFEVSLEPSYSATTGIDWLSQGGIYVLGNIRGGGEYGPAWHQAALKQNRHKAYEDFEAIAEDLIERKITSPKHLGIRGGSNGGLLMGAMLTRRPDLFNAIVCQVPLLDMLRFNQLLAGASWMGEYGNPDIAEERAYLASYSPYHNVSENKHYPRALFTTSTRDDRVHPGHARKMVAKMKSLGHDVLYYENTEGGHSGAANQKQSAYEYALIYTYLLHQLR
jgi:prolyl oligopeptidase